MTAARVPLPHWRTESRPCRHPRPTPAVHSPAYLAAFARFPNKRLIAVGKFERNVKDHLSTFLKCRFHVFCCSRNDTFLRTFVNTLSFFWPSLAGSMSETVLHTGRAEEMNPEVEGPRPWGPPRKRVPKCLKGPKITYPIIAIAEKQSKRRKKGPFSL